MPEAATTYLYQDLAGRLEAQIRSGVLSDGDRAPSVRALSRDAGVSIATVNQAYLVLEAMGLLEARPRSGYYVRAVEQPPLPARHPPARRSSRPVGVSARVLTTLMESMNRSDVLALGSAMTAHARTLDGRLNRLTRQVLSDAPELPNTLAVPPGDAELRRQIARRLGIVGAPANAEDVVITAGAMEAIALSLRVCCSPGDTVLVESPAYFGVLQLIEHLNLKVVEVRNDPLDGIDAEEVSRLSRRLRIRAAVLMPNFHNPNGSRTPDEVKAELVSTLTGRGTVVIEDDIYADLAHSGARPRPLRAFDESGLVITCGSVSKTIALGYRIGWAVSSRHAADISREKFFASVACPGLQQQVLARFLESGGYERYLRGARVFLGASLQRFRSAVQQHFPAGTAVTQPTGGVVLWIELPDGVDGVTFFEHALARRIGIAPGIVFSASGGYRNYIRLCAGASWSPEIAEALRVLGALTARLARSG